MTKPRSRRPPAGLLTLPVIGMVLVVAGCVAPSATPSLPVTATPAGSGNLDAGGISGRVTDPSGNPIVGAEVTITTREFTGTATTTRDGEFRATGVSGEFDITVTLRGYRTATRHVSVPPGELVEVQLVLEREG